MPGSESDLGEVVKWYTRSRRFPQLIGKTPDGARLWGGPYTYTQVLSAAAVLVIGAKTAGVWGQFGMVGNAIVLLGSAYAATVLAGRLPVGSRNPISVVTGAVRAVRAPAWGTCAGTPLRPGRPHRVTGGLIISSPIDRETSGGTVADAVAAIPPVGAIPMEPRGRVAAAPALTGVQRLLAATGPTRRAA